jgi:hypothetical protein
MVRLVFILWLLCCGVASANVPRNLTARLDYTASLNRWGTVLDGGSCARSERRISISARFIPAWSPGRKPTATRRNGIRRSGSPLPPFRVVCVVGGQPFSACKGVL